MEELSIEEKAKRYEQAIKRAKAMIPIAANQEEIYNSVITIFPELKESEDERIRKDLLGYLHTLPNHFSHNGSLVTEWIAWLEKQGEQKEYTFKSLPRLLDMIEPTSKAKAYCGKLSDTLDKEGYHADAKIVRESIKVMNGEKVAMATMDEEKPTIVGIMKNYFAHTPKEQQDKDWEELKHLNNFGWKLVEQKPAWSEEDDEIITNIGEYLNRYGNYIVAKNEEKAAKIYKSADWLKDLKDRVLPQPTQKWSEEDERIYQSIMDDTVQENQLNGKQTNWLRDIKYRHFSQPQNTWKPSEEQLDALETAVSSLQSTALESLYNELKKL